MKNNPPALPAFLMLTTLLAGTLDITAACIQFLLNGGKAPGIVFKYIASGIVGRPKAFTGGTSMILLGFALHYCIAFLFTGVYFLLYPGVFGKMSVAAAAVIYGVFVWGVMNLVIVPVSAIGPRPLVFQDAAIAMAILIAFIGFPVALMARKYYLYRKSSTYVTVESEE